MQAVYVTPSVSNQKFCFTESVGLRLFFAFLARNCVRCIALTKAFSSELGVSIENQKNFDANFIGSPSFWADGTEAHLLMSSEVETRPP
jgi:hypothetical protein